MKKFFVLWSSQAASMFGSSVVGFALAWYLAKETGSATILSTAMMMNVLPMVFIGPFIGPLIDRWNRKMILILSDFTTMLFTLVLVILFLTGTAEIWHIYVIMFCRAVSGAFQAPALSASVPMIVSGKNLTKANGFSGTLYGVIFLLGPPSGAFLIEALPMQWVLSVDIITAIIAIGILLPLGIPQPLRATLTQKLNVIGDMLQGFRYIVSWKTLLYLLILATGLNFFSAPLVNLLPLFVTDHLGGDVLKLGWLGMASGLGFIAGGLILGVWGGFEKRIFTNFTGYIIRCISVIIFTFVIKDYFYVGLAMWFVTGLGMTIADSAVIAILQSRIPKDMQGRFFSALGSITTAAIPISLAIAGPIADAIGIQTMYKVSGFCLLALYLIVFFFGNLIHVEDQNPNEILGLTQN